MFASRLLLLTTILTCTVMPATTCWAQAYGLEGLVADNDLQWFEPLSLDLDGQSEVEAGYFFRVDKVGFYFSGERAEIGDPNEVVLSEEAYKDTSVDLAQLRINELYSANPILDPGAAAESIGITFEESGGTIVTDPLTIVDPDDDTQTIIIQVPRVQSVDEGLPARYTIRNSILDATPKAALGWGERYEFGFSDGERGWFIGVLDGPEANSGSIFGTTPDEVAAIGGTNFGFGQVAVNFRLPEDFLVGFRNYQIVDTGNAEDENQGINSGPIKIITVGDDNEDNAIDDLNGNGQTFILVGADLDGDGTIDEDEAIGQIIDSGDLYEFNVFFDQVETRNRVEMDGIELMFTHELDQSHRLDRGRRDRMQLRYGVNYLRFNDQYNVNMTGGFLGRTFVDHEIDNQIVGPQVGLRWTRDHGKWDFTLDGRATLGYNIVDQNQSSLFGEDLIIGGTNSSLTGRPTVSADSLHEDDFSPMAELRVEARYKITTALAVKAGYNARFIDNVYRASSAVDFAGPNFGFKDGKSDIFINGLTLGVEFRH